MAREDRVHGRPLNADPAAVDQPDLPSTGFVGRFNVVGDHVFDVLRAKRVQVEGPLNRQSNNRILIPQSTILNQSTIPSPQSTIHAFS